MGTYSVTEGRSYAFSPIERLFENLFETELQQYAVFGGSYSIPFVGTAESRVYVGPDGLAASGAGSLGLAFSIASKLDDLAEGLGLDLYDDNSIGGMLLDLTGQAPGIINVQDIGGELNAGAAFQIGIAYAPSVNSFSGYSYNYSFNINAAVIGAQLEISNSRVGTVVFEPGPKIGAGARITVTVH